MAKVPIIVSQLCPICKGDKKIFQKDCKNCKATGYIHKELVSVQRRYDK